MMPEPVAQPLHDGAADEDAAFQRVLGLRRRAVQATVVSSLCCEAIGSSPVFISMKQPVP